jgi:hypothetical protein
MVSYDVLLSHDLLEKTCKNVIENILLCLEHATKGTIYRVGGMPRLQAVRIASGVRVEGNGVINWGLPEVSDYNCPGKSWEQYRDRPGHALEAMGWCVEKQKSWTADNPYEDIRSIRKQLLGEIEDFHHMEPVLVRKADLYGDLPCNLEYPLDWQQKPIWQDSEYVVVAVVKIHFLAYTIKRGDRSTKIIKRLARSLGTELLSLNMREQILCAQKELARQRLQACDAMAHELRNTLIKLSFIFRAINAEISFLREQWEQQVKEAFPAIESKEAILKQLGRLVDARMTYLNGNEELVRLGKQLIIDQEDLASLSPIPDVGEVWLRNKIEPKWRRLLRESDLWSQEKEKVEELLSKLEKTLWMGMDEGLIEKVSHIPEELKMQWLRLAYTEFSADKLSILDEILQFLEHPDLVIPHKQQSKKVLTSLKALVEILPEVEERANRIMASLKNGCILEGPLEAV